MSRYSMLARHAVPTFNAGLTWRSRKHVHAKGEQLYQASLAPPGE
jgi:hypothetical protein